MHHPRAAAAAEREGLLRAVQSVLELVVLAFFFTTFIAQPFRIPSASMVPTLRVGDFLLVDKQSYGVRADSLPPTKTLAERLRLVPAASVRRGDLVVFHWPVNPGMDLVKRVVGLPGDRIRLRYGRVWINDALLDEPYAYYSPARPNRFRDFFPSLREADPNVEPTWWIDLRSSVQDGELTVPPGHYFVLGDNRNDSEDSRYWGFVPRASIIGRPLVVYFAVDPDGEAGSPWQRLRHMLAFGAEQARILR
jgi:signal peptidase I